jgi:hypothetical protein
MNGYFNIMNTVSFHSYRILILFEIEVNKLDTHVGKLPNKNAIDV